MSYRSFARATYEYGLVLGFVMLSQRRIAQEASSTKNPTTAIGISPDAHFLSNQLAQAHLLTVPRLPSTCTQARHLPRHCILGFKQPSIAATALRRYSGRNAYSDRLRYGLLHVALNFRIMPAFGSPIAGDSDRRQASDYESLV